MSGYEGGMNWVIHVGSEIFGAGLWFEVGLKVEVGLKIHMGQNVHGLTCIIFRVFTHQNKSFFFREMIEAADRKFL